MLSKSDYFNKFLKLLVANQDKSGVKVYEMTEAWYKRLTGRNKYTNYESFRAAKSQWWRTVRR